MDTNWGQNEGFNPSLADAGNAAGGSFPGISCPTIPAGRFYLGFARARIACVGFNLSPAIPRMLSVRFNPSHPSPPMLSKGFNLSGASWNPRFDKPTRLCATGGGPCRCGADMDPIPTHPTNERTTQPGSRGAR